MCWKHSRSHRKNICTRTHTTLSRVRELSCQDAARNILHWYILKCFTKCWIPVHFIDGEAADARSLHYISGQMCFSVGGDGYKVHRIPNDIIVKREPIRDPLGEGEEGQRRKRVSEFVLSPGALKHSNYQTTVKMHTLRWLKPLFRHTRIEFSSHRLQNK